MQHFEAMIYAPERLFLFVSCLAFQQDTSVFQGRISSEKFTCCHTEIQVADPTFYLTRSQYTDTGPNSPSGANFEVTGMTRIGKIPTEQAGIEPRIFQSRGGREAFLPERRYLTRSKTSHTVIRLTLCPRSKRF